LWSKIIEACKEHTCTNILSILNSIFPITVTEAINHLKTLEHPGLTNEYSIALVELNPVCGESNLLIESLSLTNGMNIRTFIAVKDAKRWLFYGREK